MLDEKGWRSAVCRYGGYGDINALHSAFSKMLEKPEKEQMKLLRVIKP